MLGDSWLGSDFTNDDLVKGSSLTDDFDSTLTGAAKEDGQDVWRLALRPKAKAVVVWGRIDISVARRTCQPTSEEFFDEDGKSVRKMTFADFRQVGWRMFPTTMTVKPAEAGRETSIHYDEIKFDVDIPDDTFSLLRLRQGR
jgi:outer membrane lipoprotein-sorting protein